MRTVLALALACALAAESGAASRGAGDDAGSVLIALADDLGVDALALYGLDPLVSPALTPNLAQLAASGVVFETAWACPLCSPGRAALMTGRHSFRTGIGNLIESAEVSLSPGELTLPEMLSAYAPIPYDTAFFGKWHLEARSSFDVCPCTVQHGFQHFEGMLTQVLPAGAYCNWKKRLCIAGLLPSAVRSTAYMPAELVDDATRWIGQRAGPWLCIVAPQTPYEIAHVPPADLQSVTSGIPCSACTTNRRACYDAALQAFDTKLGALLASLGPDWATRVTVIFTADNGTPARMNRYWPPSHAKGSLYEGGVRVPLIIAGRAVTPALRGKVLKQPASLTDVYRTVASLAGVRSLPTSAAQDSVDLTPLLAGRASFTERTELFAETFARNALAPPYEQHQVAIRERVFKLIYDWSNRAPIALFDLVADPREQNDLLLPGSPPLSPAASAALSHLTARLAARLGA